MEEGLFLTKFADEVTLIHRRDTLRANKVAQARAFANPKMKFIWDTAVEEIQGDGAVSDVRRRTSRRARSATLPPTACLSSSATCRTPSSSRTP